MPRRLRVAFPSTRAVRLACDCGTFTLSGRTATLRYTPIVTQPANDSWVYMSGTADALVATDVVGRGPFLNQGWWKACLIETSGDLFVPQGRSQTSAQRYGTYIFRAASLTWERPGGNIGDDWWKYNRDGTSLENYDATYDPDRHRVWSAMGAPQTASTPNACETYYDLAVDEYTSFTPNTSFNGTASTWLPSTAGDYAHYRLDRLGQSAAMRAADACVEYIGGKLYSFGANGSQGYDTWMLSFNPTTETRTVLYPAGMPTWGGRATLARDRSGKHRLENYLWTIADGFRLYVMNLNERVLKWRELTTTGDIPTTPLPAAYPTYSDATFGINCELHEDANCIVAYCGRAAMVVDDIGTMVRKTWVLDLSTLRWRAGPSLAAGDTVPPGPVGVSWQMLYDPVAKKIRGIFWSDDKPQIWDFHPEYTGRGTLTSLPLVTSSGSVVGTNYYGMPWDTNLAGTKHVNAAYCPADGRVYMQGGDVTSSGQPFATWSMDPDSADGDWRFEHLPTDPGPWPAWDQDCMGMAWSPSRQKFVYWPGAYVRNGATLHQEWALGWWTYDPATNIWTQYTNLFGTDGSTIWGSAVYAGTYNDADDSLYFVGDGSNVTKVCTLASGVTNTYSWLNGSTWLSGTGYISFRHRGRQAIHNGNVYVIGAITEGTNWYTALARYNIAAKTMKLLSLPPLPVNMHSGSAALEIRFTISGDRIVFPATNAPTGVMPYGILVYDINKDYWIQDRQTSTAGPIVGNTVVHGALPDGRVCFAGGGTTYGGPKPTRFWMYKPAS